MRLAKFSCNLRLISITTTPERPTAGADPTSARYSPLFKTSGCKKIRKLSLEAPRVQRTSSRASSVTLPVSSSTPHVCCFARLSATLTRLSDKSGILKTWCKGETTYHNGAGMSQSKHLVSKWWEQTNSCICSISFFQLFSLPAPINNTEVCGPVANQLADLKIDHSCVPDVLPFRDLGSYCHALAVLYWNWANKNNY